MNTNVKFACPRCNKSLIEIEEVTYKEFQKINMKTGETYGKVDRRHMETHNKTIACSECSWVAYASACESTKEQELLNALAHTL